MNIWEILGIDPTRDRRAIKLGYAARLKAVNPEDDAQGFQVLRAAYQQALDGVDDDGRSVTTTLADGTTVVTTTLSGATALPSLPPILRTSFKEGLDGLPPEPGLASTPPADIEAPAPPSPARRALVPPTLDMAIDPTLALNLHLETDDELRRQAGDARRPGPRPKTAYFAAPRPSALPPRASAPRMSANLENLLPGSLEAARDVCSDLKKIAPEKYAAALPGLLRRPGWESLDFQQSLETALVRFLGDNFDTYHMLIKALAGHYAWQSGPTGQPGSANIAQLLKRAEARDWHLLTEALPLGNPTLTAYRLLRADVNEVVYKQFAQHLSKLEAMQLLLDELRDHAPEVMLFETNSQALAWWQKHIKGWLNAHLDYTNEILRAQSRSKPKAPSRSIWGALFQSRKLPFTLSLRIKLAPLGLVVLWIVKALQNHH